METLPGSNLVDLLPFPYSPSDISCSSGPPSVVSTRETSPASSTHHPLDDSPSGFTSFQDLSDQTSSDPQKLPEMDRDPFRTVNGRQGRLTVDLSRASHTSSGITTSSASNFGLLQQTTGRPLAPNTLLQSSTPLSPQLIAPRGLYCRDWRTSTASFDSLIFPSSTTSSAGASPSASCGTNTNHNFVATSGGSILSSPVSPVGFGNNLSNINNLLGSNSYLSIANLADGPHPAPRELRTLKDNQLDANTSTTTNMHPVNGFLITEADMDKAMGYCYDRGDGQYTRLVAVDLLPIDLRGIPRRVASDEGLIVLPVPGMPGPNGQPADNQLEPQVAVTPPPSSPSDRPSTDLIQNRIDSIVASSPHGTSSPATTTGSSAVVLAPRSRDTSSASAVTNRGHHAGNTGANSFNKRDKIYCDKWIHDGTCAFTQQGCKFKHEMPNDRETQETLGLFHGYPGWWKKLLAEQQRSPQSIAGANLDDSPVGIGASAGGVGPAYANNVWRPVQNGPGHSGESVEDVRPTSFGPGGGGRGGGGAFGTRGGSRRGGASINAPNYGPIGPPSRLGRPSTRGNRGPTGPSASHNGFGSPSTTRAPNASEANLYAALVDCAQGHDSNDDTGVEEEEQRGAKL